MPVSCGGRDAGELYWYMGDVKQEASLTSLNLRFKNEKGAKKGIVKDVRIIVKTFESTFI